MTATVETAPVTGAKTQWKLDPMHTLVEFSAKHLMITTVKGRIVDVEGIINIDERDPANSSVEATLKGASIDTRTEQRDQELIRPRTSRSRCAPWRLPSTAGRIRTTPARMTRR